MYGATTEVGICFQNSFGTLNTSSMHWLPFTSEDVGLEIPQLVSQAMVGRFYEGPSYEGAKMVGGSITCEVQANPLGALLKTVFGNPSTVSSGTLRTHTFTPRALDWDSKAANQPFTYYKKFDTGSAQLFYDMVGNSLEFSITAGELATVTAEFVGGGHSQIAALSATYDAGKHFAWNVASMTIAGAAKPEISDMTITLTENVEATHTLNGSQYPGRVKRTGFRTIEIGGTLKFDSQDEYQQFLSQSERALDVTFTGVDDVSSGFKELIRIQCPLMRYTEIKPAAGGPGEIEIGISAVGKYSVSSATGIQVTLRNATTAY